MIVDLVITAVVAAIFLLITAVVASRYARNLRPLFWLAFVEYSACAVVQYFFGLDAGTYRSDGLLLAGFLDVRFDAAAPELWHLLVHQPTSLDRFIVGAGSNTGSMSAAAGWIMFLVRGSPYAGQAFVAGLSMLAAFAIFEVLRAEAQDVLPRRLFIATVLFPSVAFWTASFHKEAFCLIGMALVLSAWRAARERKIRAILYGGLGFSVIALFRAPALPPLLLGIVVHFIVERLQKARGPEAAVVGPIYLLLGLAVLALGMVVVSRISPDLALDKLGDSISDHQRAWAGQEGGSMIQTDDPGEQEPASLASQLAIAPLGLVNALLRPQLFDVRNPLMLISAIEMTVIAVAIVRAISRNGLGGLFRRIQSSPLLAMCTVITIVGLTFVGLTTRNFGSLARYRVPFLPFYGTLLAVVTLRANEKVAAATPAPPAAKPTSRKPQVALTSRSSRSTSS